MSPTNPRWFGWLALVLPWLAAAALGCAHPMAPKGAAAPGPILEKSSYTFVDLTPAFWEFWSAAEHASPTEQTKRFQEQVMAQHPQVFAPSVMGLGGQEKALEPRLLAWLADLPQRIPVMRALSQNIQKDAHHFDAQFRTLFPDMRWAGTVYFTVSLDAFDGALRAVSGKEALLFGIDKIAKLYGSNANLAALFHHELFHAYHGQTCAYPADPPHGLLEPLWREGLAVHVARTLNPKASYAQLVLSQEMVDQGDAQLPMLAKELLGGLDDATEETYVDYFRGAGQRSNIPKRVGYYVGYRVAQELARTHTLSALTHLCGAELRGKVGNVLRAMASLPPEVGAGRRAPSPRHDGGYL